MKALTSNAPAGFERRTTKGKTMNSTTEIEALVAKAREKLSPADLARLRASWAADEEKAAREREAAAAAKLEAARQQVRVAIDALRNVDPRAIDFVTGVLRGDK